MNQTTNKKTFNQFTSYQTKTQSLNLGSIYRDPSNKKSTLSYYQIFNSFIILLKDSTNKDKYW